MTKDSAPSVAHPTHHSLDALATADAALWGTGRAAAHEIALHRLAGALAAVARAVGPHPAEPFPATPEDGGND